MDTTQNMSRIQNLHIYKDDALLLELDTTVSAGEILTIMGPSGSGKSTLLNWLTGMLEPVFRAEGKLELDDPINIEKDSLEENDNESDEKNSLNEEKVNFLCGFTSG